MKVSLPKPHSKTVPHAKDAESQHAAISMRKEDKKIVIGRPKKFGSPARAVTLTLPENTLKDLKRIHPDRGQAIVNLTANAMQSTGEHSLVEIIEMVPNTGLLVIGPSEALRRISFLHLVEVSPSRFLLALDPGNDFRSLEIAIQDVMDDLPQDDLKERELLTQLLEKIREVRKSERIRMAEILFVTLKEKKGRTTLHSIIQPIIWFLTTAV